MIATSFAANAAAWIGLPLLFLITCLGVGLLAERAACLRLVTALLVPVGLCASLVLLLPVYALGGNAAIALPLLLVATAAGLALSRRGLLARLRPGPAGAAALIVAALYLSPTVLAGSWTWAGYNFLNDTAVQFVLADRLQSDGLEKVTEEFSTRSEVIRTYFDTGYPVGSHAHLATLNTALGAGVDTTYQGYLAMLGVAGALALVGLAQRIGLCPWQAAIAGTGALASNLIFAFALQGSIKEVAAFAALMTTAALGRELLSSTRPLGSAALVGVAAAAALTVLSAAAGPHLLFLALGILAGTFILSASPVRRRLPAVAAAGIIATAVAGLAAILPSLTFLRVANTTLAAGNSVSSTLGQLGRPLDITQVGGVWLSGAYHLPIAFQPFKAGLTLVLCVLVIALALAGVVITLRRREPGLAILVGAMLLAAAAVAPRASPYADAKLLAIASPAVVFGAFVLAFEVARRWRRRTGFALAAVVGIGLLWSDAYAWHDTKLAPVNRLQALEEAVDATAKGAIVLHNEAEEFGKYYGRHRALNSAFEAITPRPALADTGGDPADLDDESPEYVQSFDAIIVRRGPAASRPPSNFERTFVNAHYETWTRRDAPRVLRHLGLQRRNEPALEPSCSQVRTLARVAAGESGRVLASAAPDLSLFRVDNANGLPREWPPRAETDFVEPLTPGVVRSVETVAGGRYEAWVKTTTGRAMLVSVDGRRVGTVEGINTPGSWLQAGAVELAPGPHDLALERVRGSFAPGDGAQSFIGPVALVRRPAEQLVEVAPADAERELCGRSWDWIEAVAGE